MAAQFEPDVTRGGALNSQIARACSKAMNDCGKSREQIAEEMTEYLGGDQKVTMNMLDAYASQARKDHRITLERFIALIHVTDCVELLGFVCSFMGFVAVPERFSDIIKLWHIEEQEANLERQKAALKGRVGGRR